MAEFLCGTYVVSVLFLVSSAIGIWNLNCEGITCMAQGIAWLVWSLAFLVVFGIGAAARNMARSSDSLSGLCECAWWSQLAMGAFLALTWAKNSIA